jgi:hypothetical protein
MAVQAEVVSRVSVASDGTQANGSSRLAALSGDGGVVVFDSEATNLVRINEPCRGSARTQVYVHERATGITTCVSVASDGTASNADGTVGRVGGDGRFIAFGSSATNLDPACRERGVGGVLVTGGVFVRDRVARTTACVSIASDGSPLRRLGHFPRNQR